MRKKEYKRATVTGIWPVKFFRTDKRKFVGPQWLRRYKERYRTKTTPD